MIYEKTTLIFFKTLFRFYHKKIMFQTVYTTLTFVLLAGYCFLFLYFIRGFRRLQPGSCTDQPMVSVIVPAHNEEKNLPRLLHCLSNQHYPKEFTEILLVDDRSDDRTSEIMQTFVSLHPNAFTFCINDKSEKLSPKKRAIQKAIHASRGEIILTTDADAFPGPHWIAEMVRAYDKDIGMVLGYAPYCTDGHFNTLFHQILALDYLAMGAIAAASVGIGHPSTSNGANFSYRKDVFQKVGGFGETGKWVSGDDDLFLHRVVKNSSRKIAFAVTQGSAVFNDPPRNFRTFVHQRIRFASKHLAYPFKMKMILAGVYAFNLSLVGLMISTFFSTAYLSTLLVSLSLKAALELLFLYKGQKLLEKRKLLRLYPFAIFPHIFYVVIFPLLGQWFRPRW